MPESNAPEAMRPETPDKSQLMDSIVYEGTAQLEAMLGTRNHIRVLERRLLDDTKIAEIDTPEELLDKTG